MAMPTGTDLAAFLVTRGILTAVPADLDDLNDVMEDVVAQWENDTGWHPFLSSGSDSTRLYTIGGAQQLFLNAGLISLTTLTIDDAEIADTLYWLRPADASVHRWPYTQIDLGLVYATGPDGVEIEAEWGFTDDMDDFPDVTRALLKKGAAEFLQTVSNSFVGTGGTVVELEQDDVRKKYAIGSGFTGEYSGSLQQQFGRAYRRTVNQYKAPWMVMA